MQGKEINAEKRDLKGKNNCNRIRNEGFIPAVLYSHGESESIKISEKEFYKLFKGHISESVIFNLHVAGSKDTELMAFVKDYCKHPVTDKVLHLDLFKVTKDEKIQTHVPVELVGTPAGLKLGGVLKQGEREVVVHCMPRHLPEKIEVDISDLLVGDVIHVSDIKHGEEIEILTSGNNLIASVDRPRAEVETVEEAATEAAEPAAAAE
ncbi:MAG TPA: 50S ribosomal protein L25 [Spirochaetota bacterium]|nr:50S ribosomal protein L25 [Spirochaetota bacterium]